MKKVCLVALVAIFSFSTANAQGIFEAKVEAGIVIGDSSDFTSLSLGVALAYLFDVSDDFKVGPEIGYTNYFGKDFTSGDLTFKTEDFGVVPILAKAKFSLSDMVHAHGGVGYAVFTGDGGGGEITYNLGGGVTITENIEVGVVYNSISGNGGSIDSISGRLNFAF